MAAAVVVQDAGHPRPAPKRLGLAPFLSRQVEGEQPVGWNAIDDAFANRPPLHDDGRLGIEPVRDLVELGADVVQVFRRVLRRFALMERVRRVEVVGPEQPRLLLEERAAEVGEQGILRVELRGARRDFAPDVLPPDPGLGEFVQKRQRHAAGETLEDRRHPERTLAVENEAAKFAMGIDPRLGERAAPLLQVGHPLPGAKSRAGEIAADLVVVHPEAAQRRLPHRLLPGGGERRGDAVERHPVDLALPARAIPPRRGVVERAVIQVDAVAVG